MDQRDRERAESVVKKLAQVVNVKNAYLDDFKITGDEVDCQAVLDLAVHGHGGSIGHAYWPDTDYTKFTLRKTSNQIRKILDMDENVMKYGKGIDCPQRVYHWNGYSSEFDGYGKDYIMVDFIIKI